ncbi:MAG: hypothetical protein QNK03_08680 [Myxococcota bacterium]|nr:hypothetical protein [Myxococcota bacterium]
MSPKPASPSPEPRTRRDWRRGRRARWLATVPWALFEGTNG